MEESGCRGMLSTGRQITCRGAIWSGEEALDMGDTEPLAGLVESTARRAADSVSSAESAAQTGREACSMEPNKPGFQCQGWACSPL